MSEPARAPMTADAFVAWAMNRPETEHYELHDGQVVAMAPERVGHTRAKLAVTIRLREAIAEARLGCEAIIDGLSVQIDEHTVFEPDALVRCGDLLPPDTVVIDDPVIVVEVVSPSSGKRDPSFKLVHYFSLPSVRHYLVMLLETRTVLHHERNLDGSILTHAVSSFPLRLDPPGLSLDDVFAGKS